MYKYDNIDVVMLDSYSIYFLLCTLQYSTVVQSILYCKSNSVVCDLVHYCIYIVILRRERVLWTSAPHALPSRRPQLSPQ